jgi:hypothetical protein
MALNFRKNRLHIACVTRQWHLAQSPRLAFAAGVLGGALRQSGLNDFQLRSCQILRLANAQVQFPPHPN